MSHGRDLSPFGLPPPNPIADNHESSSHNPIPNAVVYAFDASSGQLRGWTSADSAGAFQLSLGSGTYKLLVHATGYTPTWCCSAPDFSSAASVTSPSSGHMVMMSSSSAVAGTVRDHETSSPIDEVRVYAYSASTGAFAGQRVTGRGGTPGAYTVPLPSGSYKLYAQAPYANIEDTWYPTPSASGFADAAPVASESSGVDFSLLSADPMSGVVYCQGNPVQAAYVSAYHPGTRQPYNTLSGPGGAYSLKVRYLPPPAIYKLRFIANGTCPGNRTRWYQNQTSFSDAWGVPAPAFGRNQDVG